MTGTRLLIALVPAAAVAAGNYVVLRLLVPVGPVTCVACLAWLVGGPLVLGVALAAVLGRVGAPEPAPPPPPPEPPSDAALRLLGVLQEEGRLVDFLEEDVSAYGDAEIGSAARFIHEGCRKALRERVRLERILAGAEGETVVVEPGFDPAAVRLTGNVQGEPPFRGVLRHAGWRVRTATLPARSGPDPHVIAPAEVEIA